MLVKFSNPKFDSLILLVNEIFAKSFSFILFWFLGIQLSKNELSEFLLEMPFIFLFSTVLSFGIATFFFEQKKSDTDTFKKITPGNGTVVLINNMNPRLVHRVERLANYDVNRYTINAGFSVWN